VSRVSTVAFAEVPEDEPAKANEPQPGTNMIITSHLNKVVIIRTFLVNLITKTKAITAHEADIYLLSYGRTVRNPKKSLHRTRRVANEKSNHPHDETIQKHISRILPYNADYDFQFAYSSLIE
jgi:hypothetical protein